MRLALNLKSRERIMSKTLTHLVALSCNLCNLNLKVFRVTVSITVVLRWFQVSITLSLKMLPHICSHMNFLQFQNMPCPLVRLHLSNSKKVPMSTTDSPCSIKKLLSGLLVFVCLPTSTTVSHMETSLVQVSCG